MWQPVVSYIFINVSEESAASGFRLEELCSSTDRARGSERTDRNEKKDLRPGPLSPDICDTSIHSRLTF
jgi:hypothetical protein